MSDATGKSGLVLEGICRSFTQGARTLNVLHDATLTLAAGEVVALVGPSGSGKSTLLHIAGLLEPPDSGQVRVGGEAVDRQDDRGRTAMRLKHLGFVYQFHNLLPEFTALENVALPLRLNGQGAAAAGEAATNLLARLGLEDRQTHLPSQLSGGEQQRVAIARALANQPSLILADEPTGSLDAEAGGRVADMLFEEARAQNVSVLMATHDMELAARTDRIVYLRDGRISTK